MANDYKYLHENVSLKILNKKKSCEFTTRTVTTVTSDVSDNNNTFKYVHFSQKKYFLAINNCTLQRKREF